MPTNILVVTEKEYNDLIHRIELLEMAIQKIDERLKKLELK